MKITAQIKEPIREEMELFEQKFRGAMSSKVALLNRITYYIVNRKGKQMRPMFIFLVNPEAHHLFATSFFYTGIGLFQAAVLSNGRFNKSYLKYDRLYYGLQVAFFLIGLVLSLLFSAHPTIVITIATLMTLAMEIHFTHFYMAQTKKFSTPNWELF